MAKPKMVAVPRKLLSELLDYNEHDESNHYEETLSSEYGEKYSGRVEEAVKAGACKDHIYLVICKLRERLG